MLRRASAFLALLALIGSPAVTSTRMFCRYTGAEVAGCEESRAPAQPEIRGENCCLRMTSYTLDSARTLSDPGARIAAPTIVAPLIFIAEVPAITPTTGRDVSIDGGPPVFLTNRALLI